MIDDKNITKMYGKIRFLKYLTKIKIILFKKIQLQRKNIKMKEKSNERIVDSRIINKSR